MSAALNHLNQRHTKWLSIVAVFIGLSALAASIWTGLLTHIALELSAEPVLSIVLNNDEISKETDPVLIEYGFLPATNNVINLVLENNSLSKVEDVLINMTLWKYSVNKENKHLTVCPVGYVENIHNSKFQVSTSSLHTSNSYQSSLASFELKKDGKHYFSFNFNEISNAQLKPKKSKLLLKISTEYVKSSSKINHDYIKLYVLDLFNEEIVDVDRAPDRALSLNDVKNSKNIDGFPRPSSVYPFREEEFLSYFYNTPNELDFFSVCPEFTLEKEIRVINY